MSKWKCKKSEIVYDHKYFRLRKENVELPTGKVIDWLFWDSPDSAMVVGVTKDKKLVMIRQYRYLADSDILEFAAGASTEEENIEETARREFCEETGYECKELVKLGSFYESIAQLNRQLHIFLAENVEEMAGDKPSHDENEEFEVILMDIDEVLKLCESNKIITMASALALYLAKDRLK